jgi:hypothetical protein
MATAGLELVIGQQILPARHEYKRAGEHCGGNTISKQL